MDKDDEKDSGTDLRAFRPTPFTVIQGDGVAEYEDREAEPGEVTFDDLLFLAERLMYRTISHLDWAALKPIALGLVDESDAESVVRLMQQARVEVIFDGE